MKKQQVLNKDMFNILHLHFYIYEATYFNKSYISIE